MSYRTKDDGAHLEGRGAHRSSRMRIFAETFLTFAGESELCGEPYQDRPVAHGRHLAPPVRHGRDRQEDG